MNQESISKGGFYLSEMLLTRQVKVNSKGSTGIFNMEESDVLSQEGTVGAEERLG